jgi:predicted nucleic acid-binding protein
MKPVFADTFYWYALANRQDQWHLPALAARTALRQRHIVTTEEVLTEFLAAMSGHPFLRSSARKLLNAIALDHTISVMPGTFHANASRLQIVVPRYSQRLHEALALQIDV